MGRCPSHEDGTASLSIKEKDGKILLFCHAGCDTERDILPALGLKLSDLFIGEPERKGGTIVATYDYRDASGRLIYQSVRKANPKGFSQRRPDGAGGWIWDLKGVSLRVPYRLPELLAALARVAEDPRATVPTVYIVEGEKDVDRLRAGGLIATTNAGGAGKWPGSHSFNVHFRGFNVVIIADNDKPDKKGRRPGLSHAQDVARKVGEYAGRIRLLTERELEGLPSDGGDISDWLDKGHTIAELVRIAETAGEWIDPGETNGTPTGKRPTDDELRDRWLRRSNPMAYARGEFWMYQAPEGEPNDGDGRWAVKDEALVKKEILEVIIAAKPEKIEPENSLVSSVYGLARWGCAIDGKLFDADPDYIACRNGALHIPTRNLEPHAPGLYMTSGVGYDYDPDAKAPGWEEFIPWLEDRLGPDTLAFLREFGGLCATTDVSYETAVWLFGQPGCGKSTFIAGIQAALGDRWCKIGLRDIERSQFALVNLPGKTMAIATEQPGDYIRCLDLLDTIISGEPLDIEGKYRNVITIAPTVKLLWAMDKLPRIPHAGSGIFRRVKVVPFGRSIPESEIKPGLKEQIKTEGQGILNWLLDGLDVLRERGCFTSSRRVRQATQDFRELNDVVGAFAAECLEFGPDYEESATDLFEHYCKWCGKGNHKPMSITAISQEWIRLGLENHDADGKKLRRHPGVNIWKGCRLIEDQLSLDSKRQW
jgi:putative DNA primase/helicase